MPARRAPIALAAVGALVATTVGTAPALASTPTTTGPQPGVAADVPERAADKITPTVRHRLEAKESADFWVRFADAPDLEPATDIADWDERGQYVYDALTSTASASQADVVADLEAAGVEYQSYWISNAILVEDGTAALAREIAGSREVKQVHERFSAQQIEPVERKAATDNAPLATEWGLDAINAPEVWDQGYTGEGITVANIDSGVDVEHPALLEHYRGYLGDEGLSNDYNWFDASGVCDGAPCDIDAHGTHVMGTMVGDDGAGNQIGVAPDADWIAANGCASCSDADLLASGQWILAPTRADGSDPDPAQRPHIVNNSWGQQAPGVIDDFMSEEIAAWEAAGIFGAWAAGNAGEAGCQSTSSPGANVATYASGAFGPDGEIAEFSSRGPGADGETKPNLSAPGDGVRSSVPGGDYAEFSGTSMASPHLAGAVALLWSAAPALIGDIEATEQLLDQTAVDVDDSSCGGTAADNNVWGEGKLDVAALVGNAPIDGYGFLTGTVTGPDGEPVAGARVVVGERADTTDTSGAYRLGLEEGSYEVTVSAFGFLDASGSADVVEGEEATLDLALEAAPTTTVSGTVTDGGGHGWPLDARVTVQGAPSGVEAWTDPFTGEYSMELPRSATHTLVVQPSVAGYATFTGDVEVGAGPATADAALDVLAECTAPGYALTGAGATEEFESGDVPEGWTVEDLAGTEQVWTFDDRFEATNQTGGEGLFAEVNSDGYGEEGTQDTTLTSPSFDLSGLDAPLLTFDQSYGAIGDFADVDVSVDGGETWETVLHQTSDALGRTAVALPGAGGRSDVKVRFHYGDGAWALWWQVDNVSIGSCEPVDGGLVAGFVQDGNTGDGLDGATVTVGETTATSADPENPTVGAGYYSLFTAPGEQQVAYAAKDYTGQEADVTVAADAVVRQDVELAAPRLTVSPGELTREVRMGGTRSGRFTVTNEGTAPADVEVAPGSSDFEILGSAERTGVIKGATADVTQVSTASSGTKRAAGNRTTDAAGDDGLARAGKPHGRTVTPAAPPSLLAEGTTITHSSSQDVTMGNSVACVGSPTQWLRTFTLEDFDISGEFAVTNVSFGVELAAADTDVTVNLYELDGDLTYANMTLLGSADVTLEQQELTMVDVPVTGTAPAGSTLVVEVASAGEFFIGSNAEPETAPSYLASEDCGTPEPVTVAELGFPDMHTVLNVTGETTVDVPWLDVQPPAFTLEPGESATVVVDLDSSRVDQPGTYTAAVIADGGTPYDEPRATVSLSVTPPASWGKIAGTVTGVTCDDETVPLEGAFVVIDGSEYDVTLVTGPDGDYARWMGVSNNRLSLLSSATGYPPESKQARIIRGQTVVHDFALNEYCG